MTDEGNARAPFFFLLRKSPAQLRTDTERGKQIPGDDLPVELHRPRYAGQGERLVMVGNQMLESVVLPPPVEELRIGYPTWLDDAAIGPLHFDQLLRLSVGEWPQHHGIHDAEDSGVGADGERQRDDRNGRQPWRLL